MAAAVRADVVFARRTYAANDRTYHQIWTFDSKTRKVAAVTASERRHMQPACSPDGSLIWFLSGPFGDERNTELWAFQRGKRTEKMAVQFKGVIVRLLGGTAKQAFFTAFDEADKPALYRWDGRLTRLSPLSMALSESASLSPDGRTIAAQMADRDTVTMLAPSGAAGRTVDHCVSPVWFPDGKKLACVSGSTIRVIDLVTGLDRVKVPFEQRTTPPAVADVAPSGGQLIVKTVGASTNSTSPQSDYWVLDLAQTRWHFIGPGQSAIFGPGGAVLLVTPRELASVGKGQDWVANLLLIDPATRAQIPLGPAAANHSTPCRSAAAK
jgi:Tol biopolymer transport system component